MKAQLLALNTSACENLPFNHKKNAPKKNILSTVFVDPPFDCFLCSLGAHSHSSSFAVLHRAFHVAWITNICQEHYNCSIRNKTISKRSSLSQSCVASNVDVFCDVLNYLLVANLYISSSEFHSHAPTSRCSLLFRVC